MKRFEMKVPDEDYAAWKAKAEGAGVPLAEWIRERCSGPGSPTKSAVVQPASEVRRKSKQPVFDGTPCRHGLLYCQVCKDIAEGLR